MAHPSLIKNRFRRTILIKVSYPFNSFLSLIKTQFSRAISLVPSARPQSSASSPESHFSLTKVIITN